MSEGPLRAPALLPAFGLPAGLPLRGCPLPYSHLSPSHRLCCSLGSAGELGRCSGVVEASVLGRPFVPGSRWSCLSPRAEGFYLCSSPSSLGFCSVGERGPGRASCLFCLPSSRSLPQPQCLSHQSSCRSAEKTL